MLLQLMYFEGCPNAAAARQAIRRCIDTAGISAQIREIDTESVDAPESLRNWGSPTILLDGVDVGGETEPTGTACRLYDNAKNRGIPSDAAILAAMRGQHTAPTPDSQADNCCDSTEGEDHA